MESQGEQRTGLLFGFAAYGMWGLLPLYWALLEPAGATEVLAHRMVWSLPTALVILAALRRWAWVRPLLRDPRRLALIALAAGLISVNWGLFIWAVGSGKVIEASLGYFINPLISIAFGVLLLRERLRPAQWVAVGIGAVAVGVMTVAYGRLPWLSLALAVSFALYGLIKKGVRLDGVASFGAETAVQFLPAVAFLVFLGSRGEATFATEGAGHTLLLSLAGLATALPLIFFGGAAVRLPLSTIGLLQYLAPASMFLLGLLAFDEEMPPERWAGFLLVWAALCLLTWDALRTARRSRARLRAAAAAASARAPRTDGGEATGTVSGKAARPADRPAVAGTPSDTARG
ncbi:EamA family transporter RarD [Streptomyces fenghuangensis]|uniref:EamA family transporter RarD n=1 Tax=Streptomyces chitinivorans TaxID=1257027 RepID=A0ABW7I103_9ACTN|nr:EamA family transporter RarD [Streptomyces chitinivorans]MDH2411925.1 EamA family transporter RarD [Streptomyces chitinivorans]